MSSSSRTPVRALLVSVVCAGSVLAAPAVASATGPTTAVQVVTAGQVVATDVNPAHVDAGVSNGRWGLIGLTGMFGLFGYRAYTARRRPDGPTKGSRR